VAKGRPTIQQAALRPPSGTERRPRTSTPDLTRRDFDPTSALGYRAAGGGAEVSVRDAANYAHKRVDSHDLDAHADLGLYLLRTGDRPARKALETA
jgi:hypothetical protein